ncbi:MAG: ribulose-phosphate 3-epimerase [Candidatus Bathyarchaeia archaeon]
MSKVLIGASILSARFSHLADEVARCERSGVDFLHFDVMDGSMTSIITFGHLVIKSLREYSDLKFDVHCYLLEPVRHLPFIVDAGADAVTIPMEAEGKVVQSLEYVRGKGLEAGVALLPATPLKAVRELLGLIDSLTIVSADVMSYGSWKFLPEILDKIKAARRLLDDECKGVDVALKVDGGINLDNISSVVGAGATSLVIGGALFAEEDMGRMLAKLRGKIIEDKSL